MNEALGSYLHDHLAGATFAVELLESLREQHSREPLGAFAAELCAEIQEDRRVLEELSRKVNTHSIGLKVAAGWLAEKASRLKLRREGTGANGTFETLETLALGILGKESLWKALVLIAPFDERLQHLDYDALIARARDQYTVAEDRRLAFARLAFVRH